MDMKNDLDGKMAVLFKEMSKALAEYLQAVLPKLQAERWWDELVVRNLSRQQSDHLKRSPEQALASLDLAALLRVFDANWWNLSQKDSLPPDCRNYLKEMQSIRNRWAHSNALSESEEQFYRDIDTAQRLLTAIAPENLTIDALSNLKQEILGLNGPRSQPENTSPVAEPSLEHMDSSESTFVIGQIVRMRSDPEKSGAVVGISKAKPEDRYDIFIDGEKRTFYASQLLPDAESPADGGKIADAESFQARLSALQIARPGGTTLFSLNAARVDFIPYQFRPVIKFMRAERPRLLIADSVGVGKTIEAGLILRELQARREMQNVLIVCPKPLVAERKWQSEMRRFDERFVHLDGRGLRHCIEETDLEGQWDPQHPRVIIPYSLFDEKLLHGAQGRTKRKGLLDLDPPPRFDMVIVDEAHHIRNPNTFAHQAVRFFCDHAEAVLFMTATPLQMGDEDLFVLLRTLRPDLVIDHASYDEMAAPNPAINRAVSLARGADQNWQEEAKTALAEAADTAWGRAVYLSDPAYIKTNALLNDRGITDQKRVEAISALEALHSFAGIINRTRRRDIGDFTVRKPKTLSVDFTEAQRELHDSLLAVQARILSLLHGNTCIAFMMSTIRRQAASCIFGLAPMIKDILTRRLDELGIEDCDYEEGPGDQAKNTLAKEISSVTEQAGSLPPDDPKLNAFLDVVKEKQNAANRRIMVFSTFRHTLKYLEVKLREAEVRVGLIHGNVADEERRELRRRFKLPSEAREAIDVLLFSEVGCEGLDYQFCDTLVNYDLPWNPMRIEQRIGRLDRNGQKSESIAIYNLITPGTVDADIYDRCLMRIGVFESSVGECEEILGDLTSEIRKIADDLQLSATERQRKLQQIADNKIRLSNESIELEKNQKEFFGLDLSDQKFREDVERSSSPWLSPRALENLVVLYLQSLMESDAPSILGNKSIKSLRLSQSLRSSLLSDLESQKLPVTDAVRRWRKRLKEDEIHSKITFEAAAATQDPDADLLSPLHPLVQQAARKLCCSASDCRTSLVTSHPALAAGMHPFVIYEWRYEGVRRDVVLVPISASKANGLEFNEALAQAVTWPIKPDQFPEKESFESLESEHYRLWSQARTAHQEESRALADHRLRSLETSHKARIALLQEQLEQATDEKICRMRQSQINAAMADYEKRHSEISSGLEKADIHAEPIARGVLNVDRNGKSSD